ncbi:hypothetical protein [Mesorhizobium loti]|uniref:hypothetical protein n=1 Tax=Rhizobium loti TaxID=381 RepID=UPI0004104A7A|nr:hypothetical protein [Mesorhizobium loti]
MSQLIDPEPHLAKLKPFQLATVSYVMARFAAGVRRFLVADEVGLGKTRVAQGVVARTIAQLPRGKRADIVYVCSSSAIARQNLKVLNVLGLSNNVLPTRLTLLPLLDAGAEAGMLRDRVNFISLTPGTSFDPASTWGWMRERALIRNLLSSNRVGNSRYDHLLCGRVTKNWQYHLDKTRILAKPAFLKRLKKEFARHGLLDRVEHWLQSARPQEEAGVLVRELRLALARASIATLRPRLIIFDEFQRFRDLFGEPAEGETVTPRQAASRELMASFLAHDGGAARVLFLSATPYRMLTLREDARDEGDHHEDFLRTIEVLYGSENGPRAAAELKAELRAFRQHLLRLDLAKPDAVNASRNVVEARLRTVMSRTERVDLSDPNAGIERRTILANLQSDDLLQARAVDQVARIVGAPGIVPYWKSAPYLLSFMGDYTLAQKIRDHGRRAALAKIGAPALLPFDKIERFEKVEPGNGRMRALMDEVLDNTDLHRRIWLPPSLPYIAGGPDKPLTKTLIFSDWQMVPEAIAGLVSYEVERRIRDEAGENGPPPDKVARLLRLVRDPRHTESGLRVLALLYPSDFLARVVDPQAIWQRCGELSPEAMLREAETAIMVALPAELREKGGGALWELLALLDGCPPDSQRFEAVQKGFARQVRSKADSAVEESPLTELFSSFTQAQLPEDGGPLQPQSLQYLARVALGSPAICLLRSLRRYVGRKGDVEEHRRTQMAAQIATAFLTLFNHREVATLVGRAGSEGAWGRVLDYCLRHDLQAVLDEYLFLLTDGHLDPNGLREGDDPRDILARELQEVTGIRTASIALRDPFRAEGRGTRVRSLPSHFAARFASNATRDADITDEHQAGPRIDTLREAFNSPFRPFILASTSVGQEGLDFHRYAYRLWHWNLPGNPVDMEQREGRVQRYLCHAVRLNIAQAMGLAARGFEKNAAWPQMLAAAEAEVRAGGRARMGLRPYWLYDGPVKIESVLPLPPLSREARKAEWLKRSTALYRLAFGQPRQDDLLAMLNRAGVAQLGAAREQLLIRLAPGMTETGGNSMSGTEGM